MIKEGAELDLFILCCFSVYNTSFSTDGELNQKRTVENRKRIVGGEEPLGNDQKAKFATKQKTRGG